METLKLSPKLIEFCKWKYIDEVNKRLDKGETPASVLKYVVSKGFRLSAPLIYEYNKIRKKAIVDGINVENMIGLANRKPATPVLKDTKEQLKSELEILDLIIESGYRTLRDIKDLPISPKLTMDAIKLKNELTEGSHGFLTNYGIQHLREIEQQKYNLIIKHLISYIPQAKQEEALDAIDKIEFEYYKKTEYFEEYLKARGDKTPEEIQRLLATKDIEKLTFAEYTILK